MNFFSPKAFWFFSFIPILILMYILKQKFEEREVSSTYLWEQIFKDVEVNTPWQKLKRNLLFFLQFLAIVFLVFALANPFVFLKGKSYINTIIVIDNSGSMNELYNKGTKLQEAKERAEKLVNSLPPASKISIISAHKHCKVEISGTTDKKEAVNLIKGIKSTNSAGNINDSLSLVKSISKQYTSYKSYFYTDDTVNLKDINGDAIILSGSVANISLDYIAYSKAAEGLKVMVRVTNRGTEELTRELSLYGEEKLLDIKKFQMKKGETKTVYFDNVTTNVKYLWAELTEKDSLAQDNVIYTVVKQMDAQRVLLISEKNVFVEKAITSLKNIELFKTNNLEQIKDKYDLYIFDGLTPKELPNQGNVIFIKPSGNNEVLKVSGEIKGGIGEIQKHQVTKYMDNAFFTISKLNVIEVPYWSTVIIKAGGNPAAYVGEYKGKKVAVFAFDMHNSDLGLTSEFPIMMNNLVTYLVDTGSMMKDIYLCGEETYITPIPDAKNVYISTPAGEKIKMENKYPLKPFDGTSVPGIYKLTQKNGEKEYNNIFAVNFPTSESETKAASNINNSSKTGEEISKSGINIQPYLIILLIMLICIEWIVYIFTKL